MAVARSMLMAAVAPAALLSFGGDAYLFSYFSVNEANGRRGEASGLHLAWSRDGLEWTALNDDQPLLEPEIGRDRLMRDPSICRGPDGTYHLVWTTGWKDRFIGYASSRDLLRWSAQRALPVMEHEPATRNCWAPEVTYNPQDGLFYVYWSSTVPGRHAPIPDQDRKEAGLNHRIYVATTRDFKTFSPARLWFDPGFSAIDAAALYDDVSKDWLFFVKNENHTPVEKNLRLVRAPSLEGSLPTEVGAPLTGSWTEGPSPLWVGDALYLYFDVYRAGRYGALRSLDRGRTWTDVSDRLRLPRGMRHGTAFPVGGDVLDRLLAWDAARREQAAAERAGAPAPMAPNDLSLLEIKMSAEKMAYFGEHVRLAGEIGELVRLRDCVSLVLSDYHGEALVTVPLAEGEAMPAAWRAGAHIRATGVLSYQTQDGRGVRLAVSEPADVEVTKAPPPQPWWTPLRLAAAGLAAGFCVLTFALWALFQRRQRKLESRVSEAVQKERLRLSHDLHDGYQQLLAGCVFRLTAAQTLLERGNVPQAGRQLAGLQSSLAHAQDELRAALWTMKEEAEGPAAMAALFRYAAARLPQWEGKVTFESEGTEKPLDRRYAGALLMILQEAVGNALKHGSAGHVRIKTVFGRKGLAVIVKDDGCGFDTAHPAPDAAGVHLGLESMRARAAKIGGRFSVRSVPGAGTEVKIVLEAKP